MYILFYPLEPSSFIRYVYYGLSVKLNFPCHDAFGMVTPFADLHVCCYVIVFPVTFFIIMHISNQKQWCCHVKRKQNMGLSIDIIPNRTSPSAILLRRSWREGKRIRHEAIANLSKMPPHLVSAFGKLLRGSVIYNHLDDVVTIQHPLPHGYAWPPSSPASPSRFQTRNRLGPLRRNRILKPRSGQRPRNA